MNNCNMKLRTITFFLFLVQICLFSQGFSNKGKEFFVSLPPHSQTTNAIYALYLTSDVNTTATIEFNGTTRTLSIIANEINIFNFGNISGVDADNTPLYLGNLDDEIVSDKFVRITAIEPIVVFYEIVKNNLTGSTLLFPSTAIGNEYVIPSYPINANASSNNSGNNLFNIIATTPNTEIEITPSITNQSGTKTAGIPYTIILPKVGDIYQFLGNKLQDLSGTRLKAVGANAACSNFVVFTGSNRSIFGCVGASSGDVLISQVFPVSTWGKEFYVTPFLISSGSGFQNSIVRIYNTNKDTNISINKNGTTSTHTISAGYNYYELEDDGEPIQIIADEPVMVVHYMKSDACNDGVGDPEMIVINPIEQALNNITFYSADGSFVPGNNSNIANHYLNVIIKTTASNTFRINGKPPNATFNVIPGTNYSFLSEDITNETATQNGVHNIKADDNFIAIAYGLSAFESYGYVTGSDFKNKYSFISSTDITQTSYENYCIGATINLSLDVAFIPLQIEWDLGNGSPSVIQTNPVPISTFIVDGVTVYHFLPPTSIQQVFFNTVGKYTITAKCSAVNLCNSTTANVIKVIDISNPILADFQNVTECEAYTLPTLTIGKYYTQPNGQGTLLDAGSIITSSQTIYVYNKPGNNPNCFDEKSFTVTILPKPTVIASNDVAICPNVPTKLSASGADTYTWSPATGLSSTTGDTITANPSSTTTYTVIGTLANGCFSKDEVVVSVFSNPIVSAGSNQTICEGESVNLTATGAGTYTWSPAIGLSSTSGATVSANPTQTTIYTVTGTSSDGCISTSQVTVNVTPKPEIIVTGNTTICNGSSTQIAVSGADSYTWSPATGLNTTTGNLVTANPTVTTTYTVIAQNGNCSITDKITITVNENPTPIISSNDTDGQICEGETITLTSNYTTGNVWSNASTNQSITVNTSGTYSLEVTQNNCTVKASNFMVQVNQNPILNAIVNEPACDINEDNLYNKNLTEINEQIIANSENFNFTYYDNLTDANSGLNSLSPINNYNLGSLPKRIWVRVENPSTLCYSVTTADFIQGNVFFLQNNSNKINSCDNEGDVFDGKTNFNLTQFENYFSNDSTVSYSYYETEVGATIGSNSDKISTPTNYINTNAFDQIIYVRIDKNGFCPKLAKINLHVYKTPYSNELPEEITICENQTITLDAGSSFKTYQWNTTPIQTTQSIPVHEKGTYKVRLESFDGCFYEQSVEVLQADIPVITNIFSGEDYIEIQVSGGKPPYEYSLDGIVWQKSNRFEYLQPGEYTVKVRVTSDSGYCEGVSEYTTVLSIPNTITPNNDGINEVWKFKYFDLFPDAKLQLFDRYGKLLLESAKISEVKWNSIYLGRKLPTGTYWYVIQLNEKQVRKGWLLIKNR